MVSIDAQLRNMERAVQRLSAWAITVSVTTGMSAQVHTPMDGLWIPNGPVHAIARDANHVYVGGDFTEVNACLPYGVALAHGTGDPFSLHAKPSGAVNAVIPDGSGGWYIGGEFGVVGTEVRTNVARIHADGTLHPWTCTDNLFPATTYALLLSGDTLYMGTASGLITIDLNTGVHIPALSFLSIGRVYCLAKAGNVLYFGGQFDHVDSYARINAAAVNVSTGFVTLWDPQASGVAVRALAIHGNTIYATGAFNFLGGQARAGIGAVDNVFGLATSWAPGTAVGFALAISDGRLFLGASYGLFDGQLRNGLTSFDLATGTLEAWAPDLQEVHAMSILGDTLFAGGEFELVNGEPHVRVVSVDVGTGQVVPWGPMEMNATVEAICAQSGGVYAGGQFTTMGHVARNNLVAFDAATGVPTAWDPDVDGAVWALTVASGAVQVGGSFANIGGQNRPNLAAIDVTSGLATAWDPAVNGVVHRSMLVGNTLYLSGYFSSVGGQQRVLAGAVDITTGLATPWDPLPSAEIAAFAFDGDRIWVGGDFIHFNGVVRQAIAALDPISGVPNDWQTTTIAAVSALAVGNNTVYAGGWFNTSGFEYRENLAALDATTAEILPFDPSPSHWVRSMVLVGNTLYVGGDFTEFGFNTSIYRDHFAAIDASTGDILEWAPAFDASVDVLNASTDAVYMGGDFTRVDRHVKRSLAGYGLDFSTSVDDASVVDDREPLHAWPNPNEGRCFIALSAGMRGASIRIRDAAGRTVHAERAGQDAVLPIEWSGDPGVYCIEAIASDGTREECRVVRY